MPYQSNVSKLWSKKAEGKKTKLAKHLAVSPT